MDRKKARKALKTAAKVTGAFLVTAATNPVVFNTPEFDRRRRAAKRKDKE